MDVNPDLQFRKFANDKNYLGSLYFTWDDIVDFANNLYKDPKNDYDLAMNSLIYLSGKSGDWKKVNNGARGYRLVSMEGIPYWADAIGQIPYAINTYRGFYYLTGDEQAAKNATINMGYAMSKGIELIQTASEYGDIDINNINFKFKDSLYKTKNKNELPSDSNSYDNKMILRAVNWAANHSNNISMLSLDFTGRKIYDK